MNGFMNNINTIGCGISQKPTTSQFLRDKDSKETRTSREIDFSKWVKGYGSETTSNEGRVWEDRSRAKDPESEASNLDHQEPSLEQAVTCSKTEPDPWTMEDEEWAFVEKILNGDYFQLSNLLDEFDPPSSFIPRGV